MFPVMCGLVAVVLLTVATLGWIMATSNPIEGLDFADMALLRDTTRKRSRKGPLDRLAERHAPKLRTLLGQQQVAWLRRRIDLAGRPNGITVDSFLELCFKYLLVFGSAAVVLLILGHVVAAVAVLAAVYLLPMSRISGHLRRRREQIEADLPDLLDVLAVVVGAGIGFRSALERVTARFEGPLSDELIQTLRELDVGLPRRQAFSNLRDRTDSEAVTSFVTAFLQAEELGAPLADSLTHIAVDGRREAGQRAKMKAARTVPKVTLLVSVIFVPPTVAVIMTGLYLGSGIKLGALLHG